LNIVVICTDILIGRFLMTTFLSPTFLTIWQSIHMPSGIFLIMNVQCGWWWWCPLLKPH